MEIIYNPNEHRIDYRYTDRNEQEKHKIEMMSKGFLAFDYPNLESVYIKILR